LIPVARKGLQIAIVLRGLLSPTPPQEQGNDERNERGHAQANANDGSRLHARVGDRCSTYGVHEGCGRVRRRVARGRVCRGSGGLSGGSRKAIGVQSAIDEEVVGQLRV